MQGQGKNLLATLGYATVAVVAGIGLAMGGDGKAATSDVGSMFKVTETQPAKPKKHRPQSSEPPSMTCEGDQCWWTDLGRPDK